MRVSRGKSPRVSDSTKRTPQRARVAPKRVAPKQIDNSWHQRFIRSYAKTGNITLSCKAARIGRQTYYEHLAKDAQFQLAVDVAKEEALDELEAVARKRALDSSDFLIKFLLENLRPDVYRQTIRNQHSGSIAVDVSQLSDDELRKLAQG